MKRKLQFYLRSILLLGVFLMMGRGVYANHILGMDLSYTWVTGNQYTITLVAYGDCGNSVFPTLETSAPTICIYNGNTSVTTVTLTLAAPTTGSPITPVCVADSNLTTCTSPTLTIPGVSKFVYTGTYTLPSTSAVWRFVFNGNMGGGVYAGRASTITNTTAVTVIQLIDTLNNTTASNTSPNLTVIPTPYYCLNNIDEYNPGAVAADGDSLAFFLVAGKVGNNSTSCTISGTNVTYATGYSATAPLSVNAGTFSFSSSTGQISFNPNLTQRSLVVYNIEQYRAGVLVGTSQREMSFLVQTCTNTPANGPISAATSGTIIDSTHFQICENTGTFSFHVAPTESDASNDIKITASSLPAGSTFNVTGDSTNAPIGTFSWTSNGTAPGTYTFYLYFLDNNCPIAGTNSVAYNVTIEPIPVITAATTTVCAASTITLSDNVPGGAWSTANTTIATVVAATGVVTGVAGGTAVITYTSTAGCITTATITVDPQPGPIAGNTSICVGSTTTLSDATAGGVWSSGTTTVATITGAGSAATAGGVLSGVSVITYKLSATGCAITTTLTVNPLPGAIAGTKTVCVGLTTDLSDATTGGAWSSSNTADATISGSGVVTGVAAGSPIITYTTGSGCIATTTVTVNALPSAITPAGAVSVCIGTNLALSDASAGGTWSSSNTSLATVTGAGLVHGIAAGTVNISYTNVSGCYVIKAVTVNTSPTAIIPTPATACVGATNVLSDAVTGGAWSSSNTATATIDPVFGIVTGVAVGSATITYSIGTCFITAALTVNPAPNAGSISGATNLCVGGSTITLSDGMAGGVWSSSNNSLATITSGGVVSGVGSGTDIISYSVTGICGTAVATYTVAVSSTLGAGSIVGPTDICAGTFTTLTETVPSGVWSVFNTDASITGTGLLTGISTGIDTVYYTVTNACGVFVAKQTETIGAFLTAGTISGPTSVCAGSSFNLSDGTPGGVWSSTNSAVATISGVGVVSGVSSGTAIISYLEISGCGSTATTYTVTVNPIPAAGAIIGPSTICVGTFTILSDTTTGGVWSSSNTSAATVSSGGLAYGVASGTTTISYTFSNSCGSATATQVITVSPGPSSGTIVGASAVCVGTTIELTDAVSGGVWSSSNAHATVFPDGVVTGVAIGADTIIYSITTGCGTVSTSKPITINPTLTAGTITGPSSVCVSSLVTLSDSAPGGVWSSSNGHATITTGGIVTGITPGTDTITFSVFGSCGLVSATKIITINPSIGAGTITGTTGLCPGGTVTLSDAVTGGVWSVYNTSVATISATGVVHGAGIGTDTVYYTLVSTCGTNISSTVITVSSTPFVGAISGLSTLCIGTSITLTDPTSGGVWSAGNADATVSGGVVDGVSAGTDVISYTITNSCGTASATQTVTVVTFPAVTLISGASSVCAGSSVTLSDATAGGVWTSTNTDATVSTGGVVTGIAAGSDIITYLISNACGTVGTSTNITVNPVANAGTITGADSVCAGATITLSDVAPGGVWSAGNTNATVSGGVVTGVSGGTVPISYSVTNICGTVSAIQIVTVVAAPNAGTITGPASVCVGSGITLADVAPGGTWLSSNGNATIVAPGIVDGVTVGIDTVFYLVNNVCGAAVANKTITINPIPVVTAISGPTNQCVGTIITLSDATAGGEWFSSNPSTAAVGLLTGILNGLSAGIINITYTVTNALGCPASAISIDTVNAVPATSPIMGSTSVCVGSVTPLSDTTAGGAWSSSNTSIATVDATGNVNGVAAGSVTITYAVANICGTTTIVMAETVDPVPVTTAISGPSSVCVGASVALSDATAGGVWGSNNTAVAAVDASSGVVTGIGAGTVNINYTLTTALGCSASVVIGEAVNALPVVAAISGITNVCIGSTSALSDITPGGVWSSSNTAIATVSPSGLVSGIIGGALTISYSVTNGSGCTASSATLYTVSTLPVVTPVTGVMSVCVGGTTALSNAVSGGTWSNTNGDATVSAAGIVTGVIAGTDYITYQVSNVCGSVLDSALITVNALPTVAPITAPYTTLCSGATVALTEITTGGVWSSSNAAIATVSSAGVVTGLSAGNVTIVYSVTNSSGCTGTAPIALYIGPAIPGGSISPSGSATLCHGNPVPLSVAAAGGITYQWLYNGSPISGATTNGYTANTSGTFSVIMGNGVCSETLAGTLVVGPPDPVISLDAPDILYTGSYATYQWYLNGVAIPGDTTSLVHETGLGYYTVVVTDENGCSDSSSAFAALGINSIVPVQDIKVYPNPATSVLHIDAPEKVNVTVLGVDGKLLITQKDAVNIDIHDLANGMYLIMIYDQNNIFIKTVKFAKIE